MSVEGYRCSYCGGPLDVTPETIVAVCEYCGHANWIVEEAKTEIFMVPSLPRDRIVKAFWNRVESDFDLSRIKSDISIQEIQAYYAPYWFAPAVAKARYEGYKTETYTDSKGHVHTRRKHVSGSFTINRFTGVIARRAVEDMAIDEMEEHFVKTKPPETVLSKVDWESVKLRVLSPEYDEKVARNLILEEIWWMAKRRAESDVDELTKFECDVWLIDKPRLVLLPYWLVVYRYKGGAYRVAFSGWDGAPLEATEPVMLYHRVGYFIGALLGAAISGGGLALGLTAQIWAAPIAGLVIGTVMSYVFGRKLTADVRVEKG